MMVQVDQTYRALADTQKAVRCQQYTQEQPFNQ